MRVMPSVGLALGLAVLVVPAAARAQTDTLSNQAMAAAANIGTTARGPSEGDDGWAKVRSVLRAGDAALVEGTDGTTISGTAVRVTESSLWLKVGGTDREVSESQIRAITRFEKAGGNRAMRGALIGGAAGAVVGLFMSDAFCDGCGNGDGAPAGALALGLLGAGAGAGLGAAVHHGPEGPIVIYLSSSQRSAAASAQPTARASVASAVSFVPDLTLGTRVRVRSENAQGDVVGSVVSIDDSTLSLNVPGRATPAPVRLDTVNRLEVSDGRHSRGRNALIGAGLGSAIGTGVLVALFGSSGNSGDAGYIVFFGVALGAPIGALTGAALPPSERWRDVSLAQHGAARRITGLSVRPVRGHGVAASMTMAF